MSDFGGKSSGGLNPSQAKSSKSSSVYCSKLRPRPTKQTDLFNSPQPSFKRRRTISGQSLEQTTDKNSSQLPLSKSIQNTKAKGHSNKLEEKIKPTKRKYKLTSLNKAPPEPTKFKKLASSSPNSDELSKKESSTSVAPGTSGISNRRAQSAKLQAHSKPKLPQKSKSEFGTFKSQSFSGSRKGKVKRWQEKYISSNKPSGSKVVPNTSKTGSCVSSRRGSDRGRKSSTSRSSSHRANALEEPCIEDSVATTSRRHSKSDRSQTNIPNSTNETANTSRSTSRSNESESSAMSNSGAAANANVGSTEVGEDADLTRIQALLEARGLPPHFFGSLGPRMQQILHRSMGAGTNSKAQQYLQSIQDTTDESRQLQGAINMCQLLVMGNEDTLIGFPVKSSVPALIALLRKEHNFDLMNHACRALTYMMEALPRSSSVVVDAIPVFLEKLQSIQCMDVAEQSLTALETLSRRHAPAIIQAGGFSTCLVFIDFFSLPAQRSAINIASNCSLVLGSISNEPDGAMKEYESLVKSSVPILSNRLLQHDKKCVESTALCIVHLIDAYQHDHRILESIAETDVIKNLRQLLVITRTMLSSNTFVNVLRVITILCSCLRKVSNDLIDNNVAETIKYLLCGAETDDNTTELTPRLPQEQYELTSLICELLPKLPTDSELFSINKTLWHAQTGKSARNFDRLSSLDQAVWQWKDENSQWRSYYRHDSRMIEAAFLAHENDISITIMDNSYTIDFESMQQMNEDSGTIRGVQRTIINASNKSKQKSVNNSTTADVQSQTSIGDSKDINNKSLAEFIKTLFTILYEVYNSSAGSPSVRHRCLQSLLSMIYFADEDVLRVMLKNLSVSSHISSMLCSPDICITVGALQMAEMLMQKLPDIFRNNFLREGVIHQVKKISDGDHHGITKPAVAASSKPENQKKKSVDKSKPSLRQTNVSVRAKTTSVPAKNKSVKDKSPEQKKPPNSTHNTRSSSSFLFNFNPSKWGKSLLSFSSSSAASNSTRSSSSSFSLTDPLSSDKVSRYPGRNGLAKQHIAAHENIEQIKKWLNVQALRFLKEYFNEPSPTNGSKQNIDSDVLSELSKIAINLNDKSSNKIEALRSLSKVITSMDVSSFELQYSGIVKNLLHFLTTTTGVQQLDIITAELSENTVNNNNLETQDKVNMEMTSTKSIKDCELNARLFLEVFAGIPVSTIENQIHISNKLFLNEKLEPLQEMVKKLNACVSQLEHLPVKSHDIMSSSAQTLHFFSTKQLKCQLQRHQNCPIVRQWHGGPVRIDPLVQVHAIERYLLAKGYGIKSNSSSHKYKNLLPEGYLSCDDDDEDNDSDESGSNHDLLGVNDIVNAVVETSVADSGSATSSSASSSHWPENTFATLAKSINSNQRLNFYVGSHKLSHDMSVFQAIKQYSACANSDDDNVVNDLTGNSAIWSKTHVITYELVESDKGSLKSKSTNQRSMKKGNVRNSTTKTLKVPDVLWTEGKVPDIKSPLHNDLVYNLPDSFLSQDPSKNVLCLLKVLNSISRNWHYLYPKYCVFTDKSLVATNDFINTKIDTKCKRQLQDPLMIMTGQLPQWLRDLASFCPFLLSFETRIIFFHVTAFDRDHAMQYLMDNGGRLELSPSLGTSPNSGETSRNGGNHHLNPRLEKKKCSVSRNELLVQAEKIMNEHAHNKAVLEIDYRGEVGTGLGPTLEFFTLASREIQKESLKLWRNDKADYLTKESKEIFSSGNSEYVIAASGLFPTVIGRNIRGTGFVKRRSKFKFLGKLLGKALSDGRMLDITFSEVFYKWLLGMELSLTDSDLFNVDKSLYQTFLKLKEVGSICAKYQSEGDLENLENVAMDGCSIEDLGLTMVFPGNEAIELLKGGKNIAVTSKNLVQYLNLISHWGLVEGIKKQLEALREGFESVVDPKKLLCFFPEELHQVFCGSNFKQWTIEELSEACVPNHGYTQENPTVMMLYRILASYEAKEQKSFLQFVTGSPHLPVGGLKSLNPPLTIVRKTCEGKTLDLSLPSVMTCVNYLKLPEYSSEEIMREKLRIAALEGQNSFLLS